MAAAIVTNDILPQLVFSLGEQNVRGGRGTGGCTHPTALRVRRAHPPPPFPSPPRDSKTGAPFVLRAVAKHSAARAQSVVDAGALEGLVLCLEEFDPAVKEAAAWALGNVASHSAALAGAVVSAGAAPLLVLCAQEPEVALRRCAATALGELAGHSLELAQAVVDAGAVAALAPLAGGEDARLRRLATVALAAAAAHSVDLAEVVVEAGALPRALALLREPEVASRRAAACLLRDIVKHSAELAKLAVSAGAAGALVEGARDGSGGGGGGCRLPSLCALGFLCAFGEALALAVILAGGVPALREVLASEPEDHVKAAAAWAAGQLGRHSAEHAQAAAAGGLLPLLVALLAAPREQASEDTRAKAKRALKAVVAKCPDAAALSPLLRDADAPASVHKAALRQLAQLLPRDAPARRAFMTGGYLQRVQEIKAAGELAAAEGAGAVPAVAATATPAATATAAPAASASTTTSGAAALPSPPAAGLHPKVAEAIARINAAFPDEAVKFSDPTYAKALLARLDAE